MSGSIHLLLSLVVLVMILDVYGDKDKKSLIDQNNGGREFSDYKNDKPEQSKIKKRLKNNKKNQKKANSDIFNKKNSSKKGRKNFIKSRNKNSTEFKKKNSPRSRKKGSDKSRKKKPIKSKTEVTKSSKKSKSKKNSDREQRSAFLNILKSGGLKIASQGVQSKFCLKSIHIIIMHFLLFDGIITYWNKVECFYYLKCILGVRGWMVKII